MSLFQKLLQVQKANHRMPLEVLMDELWLAVSDWNYDHATKYDPEAEIKTFLDFIGRARSTVAEKTRAPAV